MWKFPRCSAQFSSEKVLWVVTKPPNNGPEADNKITNIPYQGGLIFLFLLTLPLAINIKVMNE